MADKAFAGANNNMVVRWKDMGDGTYAPVVFLGGSDADKDPRTHLGYQQISAAQLQQASALTVPPGATLAVVQNNGNQPARWRIDAAPEIGSGQRIDGGDVAEFNIGPAGLANIKFIAEAMGAVLDIMFYS